MRLTMATVCAAALVAGCVAIAQNSADQSTTSPKQESSPKTPCKPPKVVFSPQASPPDSWIEKRPQSALIVVEVTVDKKGRVRNPTVTQSGGKDADREVIEAVRQWRFKPAMCGTDPIEVKTKVEIDLHLQ